MAGILSKGIKFSIAEWTTSTAPTTLTEIANLQSIPSLGGSPEKVEVTTLADGARHYIQGIKDYGDLEFKFLFDNSGSTSNYRSLKALENKKVRIEIGIADGAVDSSGERTIGTKFVFDAEISVSLDEAEINAALTFTCTAALQSDITVSNPQ